MRTFASKRNQPPKAEPFGPERPVVRDDSLTRHAGGEADSNAGASSRPGHTLGQVAVLPPARGVLQTKLVVNEPGDEYEREADRVADELTAMPSRHFVGGAPPRVQRLSGESSGRSDAAPASVDEAIDSPGSPLEPSLRREMEQRFGHDFSRVRVHSGATAEQSARDLNAKAYTVGHDIVLGAGRSAEGASEGRRLIAHELTHVLQQSGASALSVQRTPGPSQTAAAAPSPPDWLGSWKAHAVHVKGDIWSVKLPSLGGDTWIGPYDQLSAHIKEQGFGGKLEAAHIVGGEHLQDIGSTFAYEKAPCVAVDKSLHATWTRQTANLQSRQGPMGGRATRTEGRPAVTGTDVIGLYDELYSGHAELREMAGNIVRLPGASATTPVAPRPAVPKPKPPTDEPAAPAKPPTDKPQPTKGTTPDGQEPAGPTGTKTPPTTPPSKKTTPTTTTPTTPPSKPPAGKKPAAGPAPGKQPAKPPSTPEPTGGGSGGGGKVAATAARAAQRTFTGVAGHVSGQLFQIAAEHTNDPEMVAAINDINKLLDAHAFVQNPAKFTAQYIAGGLIDKAFEKYARQFAAYQAKFFETFPDVQSFHRMPLGFGMNLDDYSNRYEQAMRRLRLPSARKTFAGVFLLFTVTEQTPQAEIDRLIEMVNQYLESQPDVGIYFVQYNEALKDYAFALALVRAKMDNLRQQLGELPADYAEDIRRRGDALYKAAAIMDDFYEKIVPLSALPAVEDAVLMIMKLGAGFSGLGERLHRFADLAGARKGQYDAEITRLEFQAGNLARLRGAFGVIFPRSSP